MLNHKKILKVILLMIFGFLFESSVESMTKDLDSINYKSIHYQVLSEKERSIYKSIWNENLCDQENLLNIADRFIKSCCDFSFKTRYIGLTGVDLGLLQSGECIVFLEKGIRFYRMLDLNNALLYNDLKKQGGLKISVITSVLLNMKPSSFTENMKKKFSDYIYEMAEDTESCKLLRTLIAKHEAGERNLSKIIFVPVKGKQVDVQYIRGDFVWRRVVRNKKERKEYSNNCKEKNFIVFSSELSRITKQQLIYALKKKHY